MHLPQACSRVGHVKRVVDDLAMAALMPVKKTGLRDDVQVSRVKVHPRRNPQRAKG